VTVRPAAASLSAALALALGGCASPPLHPPASGLPKEAIPATFAPLRWSVKPDELPALFPNREATQGAWSDGVRHVTWTVSDVRRVDGVPGALAADWIEGGELWRARLSFADPRRECDPDLAERPRRCGEPGALAGVYDALEAELARGRGEPEASRGAHGARAAAWRGELRLSLALTPDARGAWRVDATVAPASSGAAADAR
jgi:hypothetical protein